MANQLFECMDLYSQYLQLLDILLWEFVVDYLKL